MTDRTRQPARHVWRLLRSVLDPRAWLHGLRMVNYRNYSHVAQRRRMKLGRNAGISPNAFIENGELIELGANVQISVGCVLMAGPETGRISIGDNVLIGPYAVLTSANYRKAPGRPMVQQGSDERDVIVGNDVWIGANAVILPGVTIADGAVVGAGAVVTRDVPSGAIVASPAAQIIGRR